MSIPTKQIKISRYFSTRQKDTTNEYSQSISKQGQKHKIKNNSEKEESKNEVKKSEDDIDLSVSESKEIVNKKKEVEKKEEQKNVLFYQNKIVSYPNGDFIDNIHKYWYEDYEKLESHHGFIQWIFPNIFQSRFNSSSKPLSTEEAEIFRTDFKIAERYVRSYQMMLAFYGIRIRNKIDGSLERSRHPDYRERFEKTLRTSFHNHMRITRILSSLVMCGFGRYAKNLSLFLGEEINGVKGELKSLKRMGVYEREWKEYSEFYATSEKESVYFKEIKK